MLVTLKNSQSAAIKIDCRTLAVLETVILLFLCGQPLFPNYCLVSFSLKSGPSDASATE